MADEEGVAPNDQGADSKPAVGSPPPEVEIEIDDVKPQVEQLDEKSKSVEKEKEKEAIDGDGLFDPQPPIGILKNSYVSGKEEEAKTDHGDKSSKRRGRTGRRKLVPVWRLFRFADFWDLLMILVGTVMAIAAGLALPGHMLLFGEVINEFVFHDISTNPINNQTEPHFCFNQSSGQNLLLEIQPYLTDPRGTLLKEIGLFSLYYVALATGVLIATFIATIFWNISAYRQTRRMRLAFYRSILRQDIGWFDVTVANELSTRLADDIEKIQSGIGDKVALFLQYISTFVAGFIIGYATNWKLALVVSVMLPILSIMAAIIAKIVASFTVREQGAYAAAGGVAEEVLSSIRTVVAFGGEKKETERYGDQLKLARNEGFKKGFFSSLVIGGLYLVIFSTYALAFWYGSTRILACELSAGNVVTVFFAVIIGSFSLGNALPELETFATALGSATVVFEVIDRVPEIDSSSDEGETPDHLEGNIKFNDVVFNYPARPDVQILNGVDLEVNTGKTVALVGPSGCGKSTVIQLIQRFYNPLGGQITIDGREIRTLNLRWLRNHIGVVSQEPVLFNTTIAENIRYGREEATMEDIIQAAKNANAHDFISQLPDGYDTDVGERGAQMSGGQKQRIAIARALVRDPKILLLDEATSALDNKSEKVVQDALDKARRGRTTIVIAHRLSTIQTADLIVAISAGHVAECGTHSELMDREGLYYELVTAQTIDEQEEKSQDTLAGFRAAVKRSFSKRQESVTSGGGGFEFQRQTSTMSQLSQDDLAVPGLTDNLSRFSIEDLPVVASPSPFPGRSAFPGPSETLDDAEDEDDVYAEGSEDEEEDDVAQDEEGVEVHVRRSTLRKMIGRRHRTKKEKVPKVPFTQLLKLNKPDWPLVLIGVLCSAVIGCLFPLMAILFSDVLRIFGSTDRQEIEQGILEIVGGFIGLAVGASIIYFFANFTLAVAGERLTKRLRYLSFKAMLRQEISWFDQKANSTGALATRLASDASEVKGATGIRLGTILQTVCGLIAAVGIAFSASWELTLVLMVAFPLLAIAGYFQIRLLAGRSQKNKKRMEQSGQTAVESIDNIRTVAGLGVEPRFFSRYYDLLKGPFWSNIKSVFVQATVLAVGQSLIFYLYAAGYYFGAFLVVENRAVYDNIFRVFAAVVFTALSIGRASSFAPDASKAQVSAGKIIALLNRKSQIDAYSSEGVKLEKPSGDIAVNSVHFNYPSRPEVKVLQGLTVSVKPGQTLALVGPSGCGKSTIVSLVERFYDPVNGNVAMEGADLRDLNLSWLRRQIGIVSQEPVLFDASIAENIRYGALFREVSDQEVIEAAKSANIHSFIESLPQGYSTNVGAKGTQLSGGQKQRIAIARAIVRDPKILLLDEATSALDTESEKVVQEALDKAREGRTSIVIAHRLSTIYNSDIIAVIHNGQVIESGTHAQLMAKKGAYYLLNTVQLSDITED